MNRTIRFQLNKVTPVPPSLREGPSSDALAETVDVDLGQLFLHHYFDSYPAGAPTPDPTRFEYLDLVSAADDFRFHAFVSSASTLKKRTISSEIGQAFTRSLLHDHFGIAHFAHLGPLLNSKHAALAGMRVERILKGDVPDYFCMTDTAHPFIGEAKGRFSSISFASAEFTKWRDQFTRIRVVDKFGEPRRVKGYIVGTRFVIDANSPGLRTCSYLEDPETIGERSLDDDSSRPLGRMISAVHYSRVFSKLGLAPVAGALAAGYRLTPALTFRVPTWTCQVGPFEGTKFIGGYYRTVPGEAPNLTAEGWTATTLELGVGHLAFVGLELHTALMVVAAARGSWEQLDGVRHAEPSGLWSSEFAWLRDGTVAAPATDFLFTGITSL